MTIKKFLTESYRSPVGAALLTLILPYIYAIFTNKDWIAVIYNIPKEIWIFLAILLLLWIITISIRRKMSFYHSPYGIVPTFGWINVGEWEYDGVIWKARTPNPGPFPDKKPSIYIENTPRCPICKTELEQSDKFYWYSWSCVRCSFRKITWNTFSKVEERVEKIVKRDIEVAEEEYFTKHGNNNNF